MAFRDKLNKFKKSISRRRVSSPKRVVPPRPTSPPKRKPTPKSPPKRKPTPKSNLPTVNILENIPTEIFCKIWDSIKYIPISYLVKVVQTSKKIHDNVYYCTNKLWIDTNKFNPSILKELKHLKDIYITEKDKTELKNHIPKDVKIHCITDDFILLIKPNTVSNSDYSDTDDSGDEFDNDDNRTITADYRYYRDEIVRFTLAMRSKPKGRVIYKRSTCNNVSIEPGWYLYVIPKKEITNYEQQVKKFVDEVKKYGAKCKIIPPFSYIIAPYT